MKKISKILCLLLVFAMMFTTVACNNETDEPIDNTDGQVEDNSKDDETEDNSEVTGPATDVANPTEYPLTFTDSSGNEIVIESAPTKIASGAPSITEIIYALNKQDILYGVTEYCNFPEEASSKEIIGGFSDVNIEKVIELEVDLFMTEYIDEAAKATLTDAGVDVVLISSTDYNSVFTKIETVGHVLNANTEAANLVGYMKSKTDYIISLIEGQESVKVFYEIWHDPITAAGPGSFMDEMITMLNGENIAGDTESAYPEFSTELIVEKNPQVYITSDDGFKTVEDIKARAGFESLDAVVNERIYFLNKDVTSRPGPRIVDALELVARAMYPSAFNEGK